MALKVELKPGERIIIGRAVITNDGHRSKLLIEGDAPLLREKDILTAETANSPSKRVYFLVQLMYLDQDIETHKEKYFQLVDDLVRAAPSATPYVDAINNSILTKSLYNALKDAKALISYEKRLIEDATSSSPDVRTDRTENG